MFNLFKENKEDNKDKVNVKENKTNNYEDKGNKIVINVHMIYAGWYSYDDITIPKSSIITHTNDTIIFKDYETSYNYNMAYKSIENKEIFIEYKNTYIKTYTYTKKFHCDEWYWKQTGRKLENREIISKKTPLEIFKEYNSKYKLIETEEELNKYLSSTLDCDTWCRMKLYNKMKELGLGDGFINNFADLVGNDLDKYHAMIDLANEVTDKDTLMYLYTYKFRKDKDE